MAHVSPSVMSRTQSSGSCHLHGATVSQKATVMHCTLARTIGLLSVALLCTQLSAQPVGPQEPGPDENRFPLGSIVPEESGLHPNQIINLGGGAFQIALDPAIGTDAPDWLNGVVKWEYAGQAVYVWDDQLGTPKRIDHNGPFPEDEITDTMTRLMMSEMEDQYGRLFVAVDVDYERLEQMVAAYEAKVDHVVGPEQPAPNLRRTDRNKADLDDPEPTDGVQTPLTWYRNDQDGDGNDDRFRWNSDDRGLVSEPLTTRQEKTVLTWRSGGSCTGVLVGDVWVLSAAHCHKTDAGNWIYPRGWACTEGAGTYSNGDCGTIIARWGNGSYNPPNDMGDDIVILKLDDNIGAGNWMAMSQASNGTIKDYDNYNLGYPGRTPSGLINDGSSCYWDGSVGAWMMCRAMYWDANEVTYTSSKIIGTRIDSSTGHSGGPIFYYPSGGGHYLTGLMVAHNNGTFNDYNGGPKIPYHRSWVLGIID